MKTIRQGDRALIREAMFHPLPSEPGIDNGRISQLEGAEEDAIAPEVLTPLHSHHLVTGHPCLVATNSLAVLAAAQSFFRLEADPKSPPSLTLQFWVDSKAQSFKPWPPPIFRGLGHLAYARFDKENYVLLDLRRGLAIGRFSPSMAVDLDYWQRVILPALVGLASDALGVTVIHCACLERDGEGLLLCGDSGAGKSTLALALALRGFGFLSDDWTYLSFVDRQLLAWGLATPLKLLPESSEFFPELRGLASGISLNGERAFEFEPEDVFGVRRSLRCQPRYLVFLERHSKAGHTLVKMPPEEAARRLGSAQGRLPAELSHLRKIQRETIGSLVGRECWVLRHGEGPETAAQVLGQFFSSRRPCLPRSDLAGGFPAFKRNGPDPTRRLIPTPWVGDFNLAECTIQLRTNCPSLLRRVGRSLPALRPSQLPWQAFSWRLVCEGSAARSSHFPESSSVSACGLNLVNMGGGSFLAMDAAARVGVGFLAEELVKEDLFNQVVLARLASMTEAARRWLPDSPTKVQEGGRRQARTGK